MNDVTMNARDAREMVSIIDRTMAWVMGACVAGNMTDENELELPEGFHALKHLARKMASQLDHEGYLYPVEAYLQATSLASGIKMSSLTSRSLSLQLSMWRRAGMRAASVAGHSSTQIGRAFQRDHSTVLFSLSKPITPVDASCFESIRSQLPRTCDPSFKEG